MPVSAKNFGVILISKKYFTTIIPIFLVVLSISALLMTAAGAAAGGFVVSPYLRKVASDSAEIAWETPEPVESYLYYGTARDEYQYVEEVEAADYSVVQLNNLEPDTLYYYMVRSGVFTTPEGDPSRFFKTSGSGRVPFTFAVLGDTSSGKNGFDLDHKRVINSVMDYTYPEFTILTGDLVMDGQRKDDWISFFRVEDELLKNTPVYASRGNNEEYGKGYFDKYFQSPGSPSWYSFDYAGSHFIALNILKGQGDAYYNSFRPGDEQFTWLLDDLQSEVNSRAAFTFVYFHAPVFPPQGDSSQVLEELLHPLFLKYGVDMVFNGTHTYSRAEKDGIAYFISGGGGAELFPNPLLPRPEIKETEFLLHHLRVRTNYPVITVEAVDTNGSTFSSYRYWDPRADDRDKGVADTPANAAGGRWEEIESIPGDEVEGGLSVTVFSLPNCGYCDTLLNNILPGLAEKTGIELEISYLPLDQADNFEKIVYLEELLDDRNNELPAVLVGRRILGGKKEIDAELEDILLSSAPEGKGMIESGLDSGDIRTPPLTKSIRDRFTAIKIIPVITAGLLDGINPCAFTVIIFLLSYLIYLGRSRKEILLAGLGFALGVFFTYMLIGFGLSEILSSLSFYSYISRIIKWITILLAAVLGIHNLRDFYLCGKGRQRESSLKLPEFLTRKIHSQIRARAGSPRLIAGSLILGFFVSAFELACTGQVYLPTIVYMLDITEARSRALSYLAIYNLAFILPLIIVFTAVYLGLKGDRVRGLMEKNLAAVRLGTALLFFGLAVILIFVNSR